MDEILSGGVANAGSVVRKGDFVLRPSNPNSEAVHAFLLGLRSAGFEGVPLPIEILDVRRERLLFIEGDVAVPPFPAWVQTDHALSSITALFRSFHEASSRQPVIPAKWSDELADPRGGTMICHNDVCLENVVFRDGRAIALLDFDFAAPGRPVYDLARLALMCVPVDDDLSAARLGWLPADKVARLELVAEAYGLDVAGRASLLEILSEMIARGGEFVRRQVEAGNHNFTQMWNEMGGAERFDRRRRWWGEQHASFAARFL